MTQPSTSISTSPKIGAVMPDRTIYAGISSDTRKPMYAMPADAPLPMAFNEAADYAKTANSLKVFGHNDWRLPTKAELNVLFNNRAAIGGFDETGWGIAAWYWSSSRSKHDHAWGQRFSDGTQYNDTRYGISSVRLVCSEAPKVTPGSPILATEMQKENLTVEEQIAVARAVGDGLVSRYKLALKQINSQTLDAADRQTARKYRMLPETFVVSLLTLGFNSRVNNLLEERYVERDRAEALKKVNAGRQELKAGAKP
jgi:hypothetical protein